MKGEFRTGKPPTWRIILYVLIAVAIPFYFFTRDYMNWANINLGFGFYF
jgi:hypothetical protein